MSSVIELSKQLIACKSISPNDAGCQPILCDRLEKLGFQIDPIPLEEVSNFWACFGSTGPTFVFLGHTDVVPPGPLEEWKSEPFKPEVLEGYLYGRGAADMKTALAAMVCACEAFIKENPNPPFRIAFLITSDEEALALNGTRRVVDVLYQRGIKIDYCLVGEPSSSKQLGDVIKIGRRGSLHGFLKIFGKQGHIAYPDKAENPIHRCLKALQALTEQDWDITPNNHFPPTSMQISNVHAGVGVDNVIPGEIDIQFNFRFSTATTADHLQQVVEAILNQYKMKYRLEWRLSGKPFLTHDGRLLEAVRAAIKTVCHINPELSTSGGTSDGRFIAPMGAEVIECGVINATIHQINECAKVSEIEQLVTLYSQILQNLV